MGAKLLWGVCRFGWVAGTVGLIGLGCANPTYCSDLLALFLIASCARGVLARGLFCRYYRSPIPACRDASLNLRSCDAMGRPLRMASSR